MNGDNTLVAAATAGVLDAEREHRALLQSIVEVARGIFKARASSIFLYDTDTDELVFEAVAGEGSENLVGMRIPSGTGLAGFVLVTRQPLVIDDLENDPRHARNVAERTGYVPKRLMSVPLLHEDEALGVLQVLDREDDARFGLADMELLGLFATQAAVALTLLKRARRAGDVLGRAGDEANDLARLAAAVDALSEDDRDTAVALLRALERLLSTLASSRRDELSF
jgi:GAF domain-containing protein